MSSSWLGEFRARDDGVGEAQYEIGELAVVEARVAQRLEILLGDDRGVGDEPARQARERALAGAIGVVGLLQRVHEPAQVVVGVVGDVRRHLRVAEVGRAGAVRGGAQRADEMRLAGARLAVEQQDAVLRARAAPRRDARQQVGELAPRLGVHLVHVDGIGPPDVVLPGDRVLEGREQPIGRGLGGELPEFASIDEPSTPNPRPARSARRCSCRESPTSSSSLDVLLVLEVGARKHQLTRPVSAGQHVLELDL